MFLVERLTIKTALLLVVAMRLTEGKSLPEPMVTHVNDAT